MLLGKLKGAGNVEVPRLIAELLLRPVGRLSHKSLGEYKGFPYQVANWKTARRVVAKVKHHAGVLFPRVGFIVTNLILPRRAQAFIVDARKNLEKHAIEVSAAREC